MGNAHPLALRQRAVETYLEGNTTKKAVAERFRIGYATFRRWLELYEETGSYEALPDSGGRAHQKIHAEHERALVRWLEDDPSLTQLQLAKMLEDELGVLVCQATISNALARQKMSCKKNAR